MVYLHPHSKEDLVAQLVEHLPFKEVVLGSSPSQVTNRSIQQFKNPANHKINRVFFTSITISKVIGF